MTKKQTFLATGLSAMLLSGPVFAAGQEHACPMTYAAFEYGVPHTDMEACPASMEGEGVFCRLSVVAEVATVFAFDEENSCIVETRSYEEGEFKVEFN